ncbi:MAG: hypothetical protein H0W25_19155, partial [Acidimicrobiia bacterium]|nr:hypothetical protein [Acidimicrobiia bacterium]
CGLLTQDRAETVIGAGNDEVFVVDAQNSETHCLYNSLVRSGDSLNGGNLDLELVDGAPFPDPGADDDVLDIGDEAFAHANEDRVLTVRARVGTIVMTLFVQPSTNNPEVTVASARDDLIAVAEEIAAEIEGG